MYKFCAEEKTQRTKTFLLLKFLPTLTYFDTEELEILVLENEELEEGVVKGGE
jgi:hypothetical protein